MLRNNYKLRADVNSALPRRSTGITLGVSSPNGACRPRRSRRLCCGDGRLLGLFARIFFAQDWAWLYAPPMLSRPDWPDAFARYLGPEEVQRGRPRDHERVDGDAQAGDEVRDQERDRGDHGDDHARAGTRGTRRSAPRRSECGKHPPGSLARDHIEALAARKVARLAVRAVVRAARRQREQREDLVGGTVGHRLAGGPRGAARARRRRWRTARR